jgi:tetratricopeptide (TPR) repeat protein
MSNLQAIDGDLEESQRRLAKIIKCSTNQMIEKFSEEIEIYKKYIELANLAETKQYWFTALKYWDKCLSLLSKPNPIFCLEAKARILIHLRREQQTEDWHAILQYWDQYLSLLPEHDCLFCLEAKARILIYLGREKEVEELFQPIIKKFLQEQQIY